MPLSQSLSFLYNTQPVGISAERSNLRGPLVLNALESWAFRDRLNRLNEFQVRIVKSDNDLSKIFLEREVYIPGFEFRGIIIGLVDIDDNILQINIKEKAWHLTRRIYKIADSLKEYNLALTAPADLPAFLDAILTSANTDMPFIWVLGDGEKVTIDNLISLWQFEDDAIDAKGSNDGTISGTSTTFVSGKYGKALDFNGTDTKVDCGTGVSLDDVFVGGGSIGIIMRPRSDGEGNVGVIVCKRTGATSGWNLNVQDEVSGKVRIQFLQGFDTTDGIWQTIVDIPIDEITFIVIKYDDGAVGNNPTIYINGVARTVGDGLTETQTPVGTADSDAANSFIIGNETGSTETFDGFIDDVRLYGDLLINNEVRLLNDALFSFIDIIRNDEIPATSTFDFDIKWKSYYEILRAVALNSSNDLWFVNNHVMFGTKGKSINLDREDKIYEKLSTKIDLDTYGNIVDVVGAEVGGINVHATQTNSETDLLYNYERVVSNNNLKDQSAVDSVVSRILDDFDSITPDVQIDVNRETIYKYNMESGDIAKINSNTETQTVKGFFRIIEVKTGSRRSSIKLQFSKSGKFLPRISDNLEILEATLIKLHDLELNS